MSVTIDTSSIDEHLSPAEQAIMKALPPMVEKSFSKLVTVLFATKVLDLNEANKDGKKTGRNGLDVRIVIAALYTSMVNIASAKGSIPIEKAQAKVDATLRELFDTARFSVEKPPEGAKDEGCGDPDCPGCSSASDETKDDSIASPPKGETVH